MAYGDTRYAACLLRRDSGTRCRDLGPAAAIEEQVRAFRKSAADPRNTGHRAAGRALAQAIVDPWIADVGDVRTLLLAPDAELNLVPFGALVEAEGGYLTERFQIQYFATGRELLAAPLQARAAPVAVGAPRFGPSALGAPLEFESLPQTASEVRSVGDHFSDATVWIGADASESHIKALSSPLVLHIATHSFFLKGRPAPEPTPNLADDLVRSASGGMPLTRDDGDALERTGLALAGANKAKSGDDDGWLTARELAAVNLQGTQLVVLSACESGMGEVLDGEGVLGLRHALATAGAEAQVTSLWKVSDRETRQLMDAYYAHLAAGKGRGSALRLAQQDLRSAGLEHPFFWAGFISSGDSGPLAQAPVASGPPR
jgi:CHAT domain-containing protein